MKTPQKTEVAPQKDPPTSSPAVSLRWRRAESPRLQYRRTVEGFHPDLLWLFGFLKSAARDLVWQLYLRERECEECPLTYLVKHIPMHLSTGHRPRPQPRTLQGRAKSRVCPRPRQGGHLAKRSLHSPLAQRQLQLVQGQARTTFNSSSMAVGCKAETKKQAYRSRPPWSSCPGSFPSCKAAKKVKWYLHTVTYCCVKHRNGHTRLVSEHRAENSTGCRHWEGDP